MWRALPILVVLFIAAPLALAGEAAWREEVEPSDRPLLDRLLAADDGVREAAAAEWEAARLAALPKRGRRPLPRGSTDALSDEVDPRDAWGMRKKRMMAALASALQLGESAQRIAAARSIRDLAPAYTSVIDVLAATLTDAPTAVRLEVIRTLGGITHLIGGRYVDTKLRDVLARIEDDEEDAAVRAAALQLVGSRIRYGYADDGLRRHALTLALQGAADEDAAVRAAAIGAASVLGARDDGAVVAVLRGGLDDDASEVRRTAARELSSRPQVAKAALARLRALLADDDFDVRYAAAHAVWAGSRDAAGLVPILVEALARFESVELAGVARLLTLIGPPAEAATPGLVHALGRIEPIRHLTNGSEVYRALLSIGPSAEIALPAIEEELHRRAPADRPVVLDAVVTVYAEPERLAAFALEMLSLYPCPDPVAVEAAVFHGLGLESPALLARLAAQLASDDPRVWRRAWYELGRLGTSGAVRLLVERMEEDADTRMSAIIALMDARENGRPAIPALVRALSTDTRLAADALVRIGGPEDPEVVKALLTALEKTPADDNATAVSLCHGICLYGGPLEPCYDRLIAAFGDRNPMMHRDAADALGCWGPAAKEALPVLRKTMAEGELQYEGMTAASAVWLISGEAGPTYEMAVRALRTAKYTSWLAVHALHLLGPEAAEAVPLLMEIALSWRGGLQPQPDVMKEAVEALGAIGPAAAEALPVLRELEHNHLVRAEAREAIGRIEKR